MWEDVFLGFAISHLQLGSQHQLGLVDLGRRMYVERWGLYSSEAALLWHAKLKEPGRLQVISEWQESHLCARRAASNREHRAMEKIENDTTSPLLLTCDNKAISCGGAKLWRCTDYGETRNDSANYCSTTLVDLKRWPRPNRSQVVLNTVR